MRTRFLSVLSPAKANVRWCLPLRVSRLLCLICLTSWIVSPAASHPLKPNIIVIMADDLGYGDVSCYGATELATPHIDRLASEGLRFTSGYCSASTCTPTRYSFLTGNYAFRRQGTGIAPPNSPAIIQPSTETIASLLKTAGYQTAVIGKWHLGLGGTGGPDWNGELNPGPLEIGFDHCFLLPTTNDRVPQVYVEDHRVLNLDPADPLWVGKKKPDSSHPTGKTHRDQLKMDWTHGHNSTIHNGISRIGFYTGGHAARFRDEDLADKWVEKSVAWMEKHRDEPFFLFFSSHDLHVPRMPHERFQGKTELGYRGDAIVQLDWCVGELMKALDRLQLTGQTLIVFCSDNGPVGDDGYADGALEKMGSHRPAGKFTGGKYSVYEGGTRTPFITRWPGMIDPGISDEMVCTIDLAASLAELVHVPLPDGACVDSQPMIETLFGHVQGEGRDHLVQQDNGNNGTFGLRSGNWKLHRYDKKRAFNVVVEEKLKNTPMPEFQLFDLKSDESEKVDVSAKHPKVFAEMKQRLQSLIDAGRSRAVKAEVPASKKKKNKNKAAASGDFDANGMVDAADADALVAAIVAKGDNNVVAYDLNGDGQLSSADLQAWLVQASITPGDANLDGVVDISDLNTWNQHKHGRGAGWSQGDFNADGQIDEADRQIWDQHKFQ